MTGFRPILSAWQSAINIAEGVKAKRWGIDARDGMRLLTGPYDWIFDSFGQRDPHFSYANAKGASIPIAPQAPSFRMQVNKVAELVQLFGPALYSKNPQRQVTPRKPFVISDELMQIIAQTDPNQAMALAQFMWQGVQASGVDGLNATLMGSYLNATPNPLALYQEKRRVVDDALITGCGVSWAESYIPEGCNSRVVGTFQDSPWNLILDTGMPTVEKAKWCARKRTMTLSDCSKKFGIPVEKLKGQIAGYGSAAVTSSSGAYGIDMKARGANYDTICYYEIYSRCGLGAQMRQLMSPESQAICDTLAGDFAYLCFAPGMDYPLNCPPELFDQAATPEAMEALKQRFQWPIPFWADGSWPFTMTSFHEVPGEVWPMSHLSPAMGELKFLNWFYSLICGKVDRSHRTIIAVAKAASASLKEALQNGTDFTIVEIEKAHGTISEVMHYLEQPQINGDLFKVADIMEHQFEKRTGMTELMYGFSNRQYRSAAEAEIKSEATNVRPDDMANKVEDASSHEARLEGIAARFTLRGADVAFMCGPVAGQLWDTFTIPSDPNKAIYETDYRIEAGSIRKPNRSRDAENMTAFVQQFGQFYVQLATMGNPQGFNAMLKQWCAVRDMDPQGFMLLAQQMLPPAPQEQQQNAPNQQALAA